LGRIIDLAAAADDLAAAVVAVAFDGLRVRPS
jgi:hypothetical protein